MTGLQVTEGALEGEIDTPHSDGPTWLASQEGHSATGVRCLRPSPCPGERSSGWVDSMSAGPLSPGTRRRLLQGQAGPLPEPPSNSVAIFISSTVSGKGRGRAWVFEARGLSWGCQGNGHGSQCPLRDLDVKAARPVTHVGTGKGERPRTSVSSLIIQAGSLT